MFAGTQNLMYFDNIPMYDLQISQSRPDMFSIRTLEPSNRARLVIPIPQYNEVSLSFSIRVNGNHDYKMRLLQNIHYKYGYCRSEFGILGKGWICQNCNDYNPSGTIECSKCGGQAKEDYVKPMQFPFICSNIDMQSSKLYYDDEIDFVYVDFVGYGSECVEAVNALFDGQNIFYANGYSLETGYYLCQYCGMSVRDGDECPGCGGERRAYADLVKLERKCVYCGRQVFGGVVCQGCGARIKGLTFKKAFVNR